MTIAGIGRPWTMPQRRTIFHGFWGMAALLPCQGRYDVCWGRRGLKHACSPPGRFETRNRSTLRAGVYRWLYRPGQSRRCNRGAARLIQCEGHPGCDSRKRADAGTTRRHHRCDSRLNRPHKPDARAILQSD